MMRLLPLFLLGSKLAAGVREDHLKVWREDQLPNTLTCGTHAARAFVYHATENWETTVRVNDLENTVSTTVEKAIRGALSPADRKNLRFKEARTIPYGDDVGTILDGDLERADLATVHVPGKILDGVLERAALATVHVPDEMTHYVTYIRDPDGDNWWVNVDSLKKNGKSKVYNVAREEDEFLQRIPNAEFAQLQAHAVIYRVRPDDADKLLNEFPGAFSGRNDAKFKLKKRSYAEIRAELLARLLPVETASKRQRIGVEASSSSSSGSSAKEFLGNKEEETADGAAEKADEEARQKTMQGDELAAARMLEESVHEQSALEESQVEHFRGMVGMLGYEVSPEEARKILVRHGWDSEAGIALYFAD